MRAKLRKKVESEETTLLKDLPRPPSEMITTEEMEDAMAGALQELYEDKGLVNEDEEIAVRVE